MVPALRNTGSASVQAPSAREALMINRSDVTSPRSVSDLRGAVAGQVIAPDDHEYHQARTLFVDRIDHEVAGLIVDRFNASDAAYPGPIWDRLAAVKARYDPTNLFRLNQDVPPEPARLG